MKTNTRRLIESAMLLALLRSFPEYAQSRSLALAEPTIPWYDVYRQHFYSQKDIRECFNVGEAYMRFLGLTSTTMPPLKQKR